MKPGGTQKAVILNQVRQVSADIFPFERKLKFSKCNFLWQFIEFLCRLVLYNFWTCGWLWGLVNIIDRGSLAGPVRCNRNRNLVRFTRERHFVVLRPLWLCFFLPFVRTVTFNGPS